MTDDFYSIREVVIEAECPECGVIYWDEALYDYVNFDLESCEHAWEGKVTKTIYNDPFG